MCPATATVTSADYALDLLRSMFGDDADFRDGQLNAIRTLVEERGRLLVVEKTGWGKSIVYFIATRMLRDSGSGPTLLISPLLSLMRNQLDMAQRLGIRAVTINSTNSTDWAHIEKKLALNDADLLMISPERLASDRFRSTLKHLRRGFGLFVVDEAHCISDWGHDFRPDYRRILNILRHLPKSVPVLATTATANNRVIQDVLQQIGPDLRLIRGPMRRHSLRLQNIELRTREERLAWLAQHIPTLAGSGIVYCLTIDDTERVAEWLRQQNIDALPYHAGLSDEQRDDLERRLLANRVKALVATVALGMGFDKPDLGFVIHYQRPGSVIAYYQQIGRAGRAVPSAGAVLFYGGEEDDRITQYFIDTAFPTPDEACAVIGVLEKETAVRWGELLHKVDVSPGRLEKILKLLEVEDAVGREKGMIYRTTTPWKLDEQRVQRITMQREQELQRMRDYTVTRRCLWEFLQRELDDPTPTRCGHCANCVPMKFTVLPDHHLRSAAADYLRKEYRIIEPRAVWPAGAPEGWTGRINFGLRVAEGRALCRYGDDGWGRQVRVGKYSAARFCDPLVLAAVELLRDTWQPNPFPEWVTCVPSRRNPLLVRDLAERIASGLNIPFRAAIVKVKDTPEQKLLHNSTHQVRNLVGALQIDGKELLTSPVLLVDDMVDSRWTMTVCGALLRQRGVAVVYPFALADSRGADTE